MVHLATHTYLFLSEFKVHVNYGPIFLPIHLWLKREARGPQIEGEKRGSVNYNTVRENELSEIFVITLVCLTGMGTMSIQDILRA